MHLHEAVLSGSPEGIAVLCLGAAGTAVGTAIGLRQMDYDQVPRVAIVSSAFFVVSLIHIPLGVASVHLVLNGLIGLILGWAAFPALLIALLLQAVLFGHGGLLALGVNTMAMGMPAVLCYHLFHHAVAWSRDFPALLAAGSAGAVGMLGSACLWASALWIAGREFQLAAKAVFAFHAAVAVAEAVVTLSAVAFLRKVRPELLGCALLEPSRTTEFSDE